MNDVPSWIAATIVLLVGVGLFAYYWPNDNDDDDGPPLKPPSGNDAWRGWRW